MNVDDNTNIWMTFYIPYNPELIPWAARSTDLQPEDVAIDAAHNESSSLFVSFCF